MHGGYLRKAAVAAARTSSPAKALRAVPPVAVPRAGVGPALQTDAFSVEDGTGPATGRKDPARFLESPVSDGDGSAGQTSIEATRQLNVPVPLSAAVKKMAKPDGESASEARRDGPPALAQKAQSAAQTSAMAGVLQRLSRPATRVQAPSGLREMRAASVNARSQAVSSPAEAAHSSGQQRGVVRAEDDLDATNGIHSPQAFQEAHGKAMHGASRDGVVVRSRVEPARTGAGESQSSAQRMEPAAVESNEGGAAAKLKSSMTERDSGNRADAAGQDRNSLDRNALDRKAVQRVVEEQISAKAMPVVERGGRVNPRQIEAVAVAATAAGQSKGERKVRIGQIDVQVNNQPAVRRTPERSSGGAQKASGVHASQDLSRFLLRY